MPAALNFPVNIGEAAQLSGVTSKMIRHYEDIGLIAKVARSSNGYRMYSEHEVHTLRFIKRAREFGFSIAHIAQLLSLWRNQRASSEVKMLARRHIAELDEKIAAMLGMRDALARLLQHCPGDAQPDCPVIDALATEAVPHDPPKQRARLKLA